MNDLIGRKEAAKFLDMCTRTFDTVKLSPGFPKRIVPAKKKEYFKKSELERWLDKRRV